MLTRYFISFNFAAIITFGFFYAMQALISQGEVELNKADERIVIRLSPVRDPVETVKRDRIPEKPIIEEAPKVVILQPSGRGANPQVPISVAKIPIVPKKTDHTNFTIIEGVEQPIFRVAPQYPTRLLENGTEGYVRVMFTVTAVGNVTDVKVIESSHPGFERNAVRAAEKFKYKPKVVNGIAVEVKGVTNRIEFNLEK